MFYPTGQPHKREPEYAPQHVTTIEINSTFYGRQKRESFAARAKAVPDGFRFSVKALQYTSARKVLSDSELWGADVSRTRVHRTWQTARTDPLAVRDTKAFDPGNFARFVDLIPDNQDGMPLRHALEPHHDSFRDPAFYDPPARETWRSHLRTMTNFRASMSQPPTLPMPACYTWSKS